MKTKFICMVCVIASLLMIASAGFADGGWLAVVKEDMVVYLDAARTRPAGKAVGKGEVVFIDQEAEDYCAVSFLAGYILYHGYLDKAGLLAMTADEAAAYQAFADDGFNYNGVYLKNLGENKAFTAQLTQQESVSMSAQDAAKEVEEAIANTEIAGGDWMILKQPESQYARMGEQVTFTVTADNISAYLWQYTTNGTEWKDTSTKKNTISFEATASTLARKYRCRLTDNAGRIAFTDEVSFKAPAESEIVAILAQPQYCTAALGDTAAFYVNAVNAIRYRWQVKTGSYWADVDLTGSDGQTLMVPVSYPRLMYKYRCVITGKDMGETISAEAGMYVKESGSVHITAATTNLAAKTGEEVTFTVEAENAVSYQWLYTTSRKSDVWYKLTVTGADTNTLTFKTSSTRFKQRFKCLIMDAQGNGIYSDPVVVDQIKE